MTPLLAVALGILFAVLVRRYSREAAESIEEYCAAGEAFTAWQNANPTLAVSDSTYAQTLVRRRIAAEDRFLRFHPFCHDKESYRQRMDFLESLLHEPPPDPPPGKSKRPPVTPSKLEISGSFFI